MESNIYEQRAIHPKQRSYYELKKVGKHWIIKAGGKVKQLQFANNAREVYLDENIIAVDDILYEIKEDCSGDIFTERVSSLVCHSDLDDKNQTKAIKQAEKCEIEQDIFDIGSGDLDKGNDEYDPLEAGQTEVDSSIERCNINAVKEREEKERLEQETREREEQEYQERMARLEKIAAKQRQREAKIEERERKKKEETRMKMEKQKSDRAPLLRDREEKWGRGSPSDSREGGPPAERTPWRPAGGGGRRERERENRDSRKKEQKSRDESSLRDDHVRNDPEERGGWRDRVPPRDDRPLMGDDRHPMRDDRTPARDSWRDREGGRDRRFDNRDIRLDKEEMSRLDRERGERERFDRGGSSHGGGGGGWRRGGDRDEDRWRRDDGLRRDDSPRREDGRGDSWRDRERDGGGGGGGDKPSAPKNLTICDITSESCHLHWQKPDHENGSSIAKYIVQMCETSENDWKEAGSSTTTDIVVHALQRKTQYLFRVAAENKVGTGAFEELPVPITTDDSSDNPPNQREKPRDRPPASQEEGGWTTVKR